jgi:outer membrane protein assembly factor BamB
MVFVTSFGNNLYAFQARGGTEKFRVSLPGRPASGPVRFGRRLVVATYDGAIVEVDPQKGAVSKTFVAPGELATPPAFRPVLPSAGTEWYKAHRIALSLRTGEVLLLGHQPKEEEEKENEPEPPPRKPGTTREDTLSWK